MPAEVPQGFEDPLSFRPDHRRTFLDQRIVTEPECTERVNYQIPVFWLKRDFVAMSTVTKHVGFHNKTYAFPWR